MELGLVKKMDMFRAEKSSLERGKDLGWECHGKSEGYHGAQATGHLTARGRSLSPRAFL